MACATGFLEDTFPRISARTGQVVDLNIEFYKSGVLTDPYAIRFIQIYKTQVLPHNLVATIPVVTPDDPLYPAPVVQETDTNGPVVGKYHLPYSIPTDFIAPDVYFDVWYYFAENPCPDDGGGTGGTGTEPCDLDDPQFDSLLLSCCHRFWVYPNEWFCGDKLQTIRFGFEPLDNKFNYPETRPLEIGLMPLPLYDYNFNLVNPLIPMLCPEITIETQNCETLVDCDPCRMGIRQGSYRSNPYVIQYDLDTTQFLKGTYRYQISLSMPDGTKRVSQKFMFSIM